MNAKVRMPGVAVGLRKNHSFSVGGIREAWPSSRAAVHTFVEGGKVKAAIGCVILFNTALVVVETDLSAACDGVSSECEADTQFTRIANMVFLAIYVAEMSLKLFAHRLAYFYSPPDLFDMFIVLVGITGMFLGNVLPGVGILRLFRVARVLRAVNITQKCDEVKVFISGIASAGKAILVGSVLIFFSLFLFSIAAVMLLNPVNQELVLQGVYEGDCDRCPRAYSSVTEAMLTLLQTVIFGDAWGDFAVPIIEHRPVTVFFYIITSFTITLGLTNLVLAVIVDKALENREVSLQNQAAEHTRELEEAQQSFVKLCAEIDEDESGFVTLQELLNGFEKPDFQAVLTLMDIGKDDLKHVFDIMDTDKSGQVSYEEFSMQLQSLKSQDLHTMTSFVKHYVFEIHDQLVELRELMRGPEEDREHLHAVKKKTEAAQIASVQPALQEHMCEMMRGPEEDREHLHAVKEKSEAAKQEQHAEAPAATPAIPTQFDSLVQSKVNPNDGDVIRRQMQDIRCKFDSQVALLQQTIACEMDLQSSLLQALNLNSGDTSAAIAQTQQSSASIAPARLVPLASSLSPALAMQERQSGASGNPNLMKVAGPQIRPTSNVATSGSPGGTRFPL